ncbi:glycoside hydrolase family 5 protein [Schizophyllum commune Tattone D]|nr:glycoside hydrolase family 5 protein [Schizophyllum commune Tattone D]
MPRIPSASPATGAPAPSHLVHTVDASFVDGHGRTLLLRGVNLSGSSKAPVQQPSYILDDFWEAAERGGLSFVGRPLDIDDGSADEHLARLRGWGFNMLRFPVTWEAIEHEGPGKYDEEYMDYTVRVLRKCKEHGFKVFMDPHQDVWSRFSGGSGAPYWTLPAIGINPRAIHATQAALIHAQYPDPEAPDPASLPAMIWSTNYGRLLSQTIFTLFFAGRDFAPRCIIDGKNIQDWLQEHYIAAMGAMADRIRDAGDLADVCVLGWDSMNEPFEGLCGWADLNANPDKQGSTLKKGTYPTPAQSLRLGMGKAQTVDHWSFGALGPSKDGTTTIDPKGTILWADSSTEPDGVHPRWGWRRDPGWALGTCPWAQHGVWDVDTGFVLRPDYFRALPGTSEDIEFVADYWRPHFEAFAARIRQSQPEAILFIEPPVFAEPPEIGEDVLKGRAAYSAHYYDGLTLVTRHWNWFNADALGLLRGKYSNTLQAVKIGERAIRKSLRDQLGMLKADALTLGAAYPTLIGEIGTPFDMDNKRAYGWTDNGKYRGDYSRQERALDASLNAADGSNGLNFTIWTYCPDSCHDWGDGWNMEDLSLWSEDDLRGGEEAKGGPAASSLTLATLNGGSRSCGGKGPANPYAFLTDGARAVRAFARPFPEKVVGRATSIEFDIGKAEFKVSVRVSAADKPRRRTDSDAEREEEEVATEIFLPLVHYAAPRWVEASRAGGYPADSRNASTVIGHGQSAKNSAEQEQERDQIPEPQSAVTTVAPSLPEIKTVSSLDIQRPESTNQSSPAAPTLVPTSLQPSGKSTPTLSKRSSRSSLSANELTALLGEDGLIDVDVVVSEGRWAVEGQTLRWWYDVPADGEKELTIEVRRKGGPIKVKAMGEAQAAGWWWQALCPLQESGCVIG